MPETTAFLPFHAINEFMRPDFRLAVIRDVLTRQSQLPRQLSGELDKRIKKYVTIPGFRSSEKAPSLMKVLPTSKAFEIYPDLVSAVISSWVSLYSALRDQVYEVFRIRKWEMISDKEALDLEDLSIDTLKSWPIFPYDIDRSKLPGFYPNWPKNEDFETLYNQFIDLFPNAEVSIDKVSLMAVWLCMRLPYHIDNEGGQQE